MGKDPPPVFHCWFDHFEGTDVNTHFGHNLPVANFTEKSNNSANLQMRHMSVGKTSEREENYTKLDKNEFPIPG